MTESLSILFGTQAKLRLLRMFLFNQNTSFSFNDILRRTKLSHRTAKTELNQIERAGLIKRKFVYEFTPRTAKRRRVVGYNLDDGAAIVKPLRTFLLETAPINAKTLQRHLRGIGKVQVLVAAGVFMKEFDRRIDVLVAVDALKPSKVENAIRNLEAELGIEIKYTALSTEDLKYRIGMYDKLTRDVFDYAHEIVIDKIGVKHELRR